VALCELLGPIRAPPRRSLARYGRSRPLRAGRPRARAGLWVGGLMTASSSSDRQPVSPRRPRPESASQNARRRLVHLLPGGQYVTPGRDGRQAPDEQKKPSRAPSPADGSRATRRALAPRRAHRRSSTRCARRELAQRCASKRCPQQRPSSAIGGPTSGAGEAPSGRPARSEAQERAPNRDDAGKPEDAALMPISSRARTACVRPGAGPLLRQGISFRTRDDLLEPRRATFTGRPGPKTSSPSPPTRPRPPSTPIRHSTPSSGNLNPGSRALPASASALRPSSCNAGGRRPPPSPRRRRTSRRLPPWAAITLSTSRRNCGATRRRTRPLDPKRQQSRRLRPGRRKARVASFRSTTQVCGLHHKLAVRDARRVSLRTALKWASGRGCPGSKVKRVSGITGRHLLRSAGQPVVVCDPVGLLAAGPRNVLIQRADGVRVVRPFLAFAVTPPAPQQSRKGGATSSTSIRTQTTAVLDAALRGWLNALAVSGRSSGTRSICRAHLHVRILSFGELPHRLDDSRARFVASSRFSALSGS
jgi:hypothetical protein